MKSLPIVSAAVIAVGAVGLGLTLKTALEQPPQLPGRVAANAQQERLQPRYDYDLLRKKITYSQASLAEARQAMTDPDPVSLSNTIHAFYSMRVHRGVIHLLNGMWNIDVETYPELAWLEIAKPPARIALASTINRIRIIRTEEYQTYIKAHKDHEHEFIRAQVAVALGFNGDLEDLPYLKAMSDGNNHYVAQSAITGLSLFGGKQARDVLIELADKHYGSSRGDLMTEMLRQAYNWPKPTRRAAAAR